jgi:O-antigen/teichoic acid export membrane protein
VVLAAIAGAAGGVWILASAVPRRERRPKAFVLANLSRPALVLAATVPLVAVDPSVENAVLGLAIGSAAAAVVTLFAIRRSFRLAFKGSDVRSIARGGLRYAPLIISFFVISNGGILLLAQYEAESEVGLFRVAVGVAALASLPVGAFITAWGPLRKEPIYGAVEAERGKLAASGLLASYFVLAAIGILLTLAVGADLLVRVAPGSYADAAPLIPIVGLGLILYGLLRVIRRSARFPRRIEWYIGLAVLGAIVFVGACVLLIPPLGTYGAALAGVAAFLAAALGMFMRSQLGGEPIPFAYGRILGGLGIGAACYAFATLVGDAAGSLEPVVRIAAIVAYPVLLTATGIVPRAHLLPLRRVAKAALPGGSAAANGRVDLNGLDHVHRALLEVLIRHRRPIGDVAPLIGVPSNALEASFVEALREVAGVAPSSRADPRIGAYLLSSAPVAARDQLWRHLSATGADALEVDALILTLERLRRAPERTWRHP